MWDSWSLDPAKIKELYEFLIVIFVFEISTYFTHAIWFFELTFYPLHAFISLLSINLPHALILDSTFWVLIALPSCLKLSFYMFSL
jgi:predicted CDP-diglyceride synthetase/phosphatidate cytidylyltransferase